MAADYRVGVARLIAKDNKIGRSEALRHSMLALMEDKSNPPEFAHPAYWAPFVVAGKGGLQGELNFREVSGIGIGGHLTAPPLPHHRAYGSRTTAVRPG